MSDHDLLLQAVEVIYQSGTEREQLPAALETVSRMLGGVGATLEIVDKKTRRLTRLWAVGVPTLAQTPYIEQFSAFNPRIPFSCRVPAGELVCDGQIMDEKEKDRNPFYAEFLSQVGLRHFLAAVLEQTTEKMTELTVQRSPQQGHVGQREIELMRRLVPHFQRAHDTAERLRDAVSRRLTFENALSWLTDGVALLGSDGRVVYANEAFCEISRRGDGFHIAKGLIEFLTLQSRDRFKAAFSSISKIGDNLLLSTSPTDFPVPRSNDLPAYTVTLRPLVQKQLEYPEAVVLLLIHDPLMRNRAAKQLLQQLFNLTAAEANLAQALCAGMATAAYASTRRVSLNTTYTHLRRIREKTGCNSVSELMRKFGELNLPLRLT